MIKRTNNVTLLILILSSFLFVGCSGNRFKDGEMKHVFLFGFTGHDSFKFCKQHIPSFLKYSNGVNPSHSCNRFQYYTCHVEHYCNGDKQCELEAAQYWTSPYLVGEDGKYIKDPLKRAEVSKRGCDLEAAQCNSAQPNDQTCRGYKGDKSKNSPKK